MGEKRAMLFSQRHGYKPRVKGLQIESMDSDLRNRLWNVVFLVPTLIGEDDWWRLFWDFWGGHLKKPLDEIPTNTMSFFKQYFFACEWHEVYSLLELLAANKSLRDPAKGFVAQCNKVLEAERAAYRFVGTKIAPITSADEIEAIEEAGSDERIPAGARTHLESALQKLSDRKNPDYRNSIKESISAVESLCRHVTNDPKATLRDALKEMKQTHGMHLHGALNAAFDKLYGLYLR